MVRILQIVDHMGLGGIQAFIMNVYRNIDRSQIQFDFLVHKKEGNSYKDEIERLGGIMYFVPARNKGIIINRRSLDRFFKFHPEYKVVHLHESSLSYIEPLVAAKHNGVPIRVIHSHSTRMGNNIAHKILHLYNSQIIHKVATHYLACGEQAGLWMYGHSKVKNKYQIVYNGINLKQFEFNENVREKIRNELGLQDSTVFCHIGRFDEVKNHSFLLDVFSEIVKNQPNSKLFLVGNGVLMEDIQKKSIKLGLQNNVLFLGFRNDIYKLVQAADAIILPSFYEGFPVCAIEAQASGLPFFMSDRVTKEALIKSNSFSLSLRLSPKEWALHILSNLNREVDNSIMYKRGLDIKNTVDTLMSIYYKS